MTCKSFAEIGKTRSQESFNLEDFELLFTVAASDAVDLKDAWRTQFPEVPLSLIGRTERDSGLRLKQKDGVRTLGSGDGYDHFQQS